MADPKHSNQSPSNGGVHVIQAYEFADATALNAASFISSDIGKVAYQSDTGQFYIINQAGAGADVAFPIVVSNGADPIQGSILYYNGSMWVSLDPSDDGYVLSTNGIGSNPQWESLFNLQGSPTDHGVLSGLADDDHQQYLLTDGTRAMSGSLDFGDNSAVNINNIDFDNNNISSPTHLEGRVFYDKTERALSVYNDNTQMTHQLGQELVLRVYNNTAETIFDGYAVYITGSFNENGVHRPTIALCRADTFVTSRLIGITTTTIGPGEFGYTTNRGFVNNINLSMFSVGDTLYVSDTEAGFYRASPPPSGNYTAFIGYVVNNSVNGRVLVATEINLATQTGSAGQASTGLIYGGLLSINEGDNTLFDISAGNGEIVDGYSDPGDIMVITVNWNDIIGVSATYLATASFTWIGIDETGSVVQIPGRDPTHIEARTTIWLGRLGHPTNTAILGAASRPFGAIQPALTGADLARSLGAFNISGNVYSANGANLQLNKSLGEAFLYGSGFQLDNRDPNTVHLNSISPITFAYRYRNGGGAWSTAGEQTSLIPGFYDAGTGTLQAVPSNRWTIQRIQLSTTGSTIIYYGQVLYTSLASAISSIPDSTEVDPSLSETITRGWVVLKGNALDLTNTANNYIAIAGNGPGFAQVAGSVGITDHGFLNGLLDDDHTQYLLIDGTRSMTGSLNLNNNNVTNVKVTTFSTEFDNGNSGTADTITWNNGQNQRSTLTDNVTFTFTAPTGISNLRLKLIQDGVGGRTVLWPGTVKWPGGVAPTLSTGIGAIDIIELYYDGTNYYGKFELNYL